MSMPHTCVCEICRREMSPMFIGMDLAKGPDVTTFWCTKHGPCDVPNHCAKCETEKSPSPTTGGHDGT